MSGLFGNWLAFPPARKVTISDQYAEQMGQALQQWNRTTTNWAMVTATWQMPSLSGESPAVTPEQVEPVPLAELTVGMEQGNDERIARFL